MLEIRFGSIYETKEQIVISGITKAIVVSAIFPLGIGGLIFGRIGWQFDLARLNKFDYIFICISFAVSIILLPSISFFYIRNHLFKKFNFTNDTVKILFKEKITREIKLDEIKGFAVTDSNITLKTESAKFFSEVGMGNLSPNDLDSIKAFFISKNIPQIKISPF